MRKQKPGRGFQGGWGYLGMLFLVFLLSLGLGTTVEIDSTLERRDREVELVAVGNLYREAIESYYLSATAGPRRYPASLEYLLKDSRHLVTRRYMRRNYLDPMTSRPFTALVAPDGGIWGVASVSGKKPLRVALPGGAMSVDAAQSYRDWQFIYRGTD